MTRKKKIVFPEECMCYFFKKNGNILSNRISLLLAQSHTYFSLVVVILLLYISLTLPPPLLILLYRHSSEQLDILKGLKCEGEG